MQARAPGAHRLRGCVKARQLACLWPVSCLDMLRLAEGVRECSGNLAHLDYGYSVA